jgi:septum formation protein
MEVILGSQSPRRQQVLAEAGYAFATMSADIDEKAIRDSDFERLPLLIARAKAAALLERIVGEALLITADQVVVCNGELREKPSSPDEASRFLLSYAEYPAQTNSAVVVTNTRTYEQVAGIDIASVHFTPMPEAVVSTLAYDDEILGSGGAIVIRHPLMSRYVEHIEGTPDSVMGLPMALTTDLMAQVWDE